MDGGELIATSLAQSFEADAADPSAAEDTINHINIPSPEICVICLDLLYAAHDIHQGQPNGNNGKAIDQRKKGDPVTSLATCLPCSHSQFHFPCLGTWLNRSRLCPLCKNAVRSIALRDSDVETHWGTSEVIHLPDEERSEETTTRTREATDRLTGISDSTSRASVARQQTRVSRKRSGRSVLETDPVLRFRRTLYERQIPSLYRGRGVTRSSQPPPSPPQSSVLSKSTTYRSRARHLPIPVPERQRSHAKRPIRPPQIGPSSLSHENPDSASLIRLATIWIRRELSIFAFLEPGAPSSSVTDDRTEHSASDSQQYSRHYRRPRQRQTTAPFLLNYILAILAQIDLSGSAGQAVTLIAEYLGEANARLFVHEFKAFLNSGCESVEAWDQGDNGAMYWFEPESELRDGMGHVLGRA